MSLNFVTDNPKSWPDEYEGTAQTVERLRVCRRDVRKYEVCSRIPARKPVDSMRPEFELYSFSAAKEGTRALHRLFARDCDYVKHGSYFHQLRRRPSSKTRLARSLFVREGAVIQLWEFETGNTKFATVLHIRRWLFLLPLLIAALFLALTLTFCGSGSSSSSGSLGFLDGAKSSGGSAAPVVSIRYASYDSGDDEVTWNSQVLKQPLELMLPATCTHGGATGRNPVDSSPSVYVDLDGSGTFDDSECVWNAPDSTGYGKLLAAGSEVDTIELSQKVPAGRYSAMTVWRSVLSSDHSKPAGQSAFTWALTVE